MYATDDLARRADSVVQSIGILNIESFTLFAVRKIKFVVVGDALQQVPRPFETQLRLLMEQQVGFVGPAKPVTKFNAGPRPTGVYTVILVNANKKPRREKCYKRRGLNLIL
jgi:hypothetical protein